jgi:hypothetical protein
MFAAFIASTRAHLPSKALSAFPVVLTEIVPVNVNASADRENVASITSPNAKEIDLIFITRPFPESTI